MRKSQYILLANYLYMSGVGLLSPIYALFVLDIGGNGFIAGASWSLYLITAGLFMLLFSKQEDISKNARPFLVGGYAVAAMSTFMYLLVSSIPQLFLLQIVHAIGIGILTPSLRAAYAGAQDKTRQAHEWALFDGGIFILQGVAALIGGTLLVTLGFTTLFVFMGIIQLISAIVVSRVDV